MDKLFEEIHEFPDKGIKTMGNIYEAINKAAREAEKQRIRANAIVISPEFHYIREHLYAGENGLLVPPMLCGMKAYIDTNGELPEEYAFAIVDSEPPKTEEDRIRAEYLAKLQELSIDDLIKTVYGKSIKERDD